MVSLVLTGFARSLPGGARAFIERWLGWKDRTSVYLLICWLLLLLALARTGLVLGLSPLLPVERVSVPFRPFWTPLHDVLMVVLAVAAALIAPRSRPPWPPSPSWVILAVAPLTVLPALRLPLLSIVTVVSLLAVLLWKTVRTGDVVPLAIALAIASLVSVALSFAGLALGSPLLTRADPLVYVLSLPQPFSHVLLLLGLLACALPLVRCTLERGGARPGGPLSATMLVLGALLALALYMLPYTYAVNPRALVATTDIPLYAGALEELREGGVREALVASPAVRGDRPLYMLLLYALMRMLDLDPWTVATVSGWLWTPLVVFSAWLLAREAYGGRAAGIAALLAATTHVTLAFVYGGLQANQLNLAVLLLAAALLTRGGGLSVLLAMLLLVLSPFVHFWSWAQVAPALVLWALLSRRLGAGTKVLVLSACLGALAGVLMLPPTGERLESALGRILDYLSGYSSYPLSAKLGGVGKALSVYLWGTLGQPLLYAMSLVGCALAFRRGAGDPSMAIALVTAPLVLIASPDWTMVSRLVTNVPLQVTASFALSHVDERLSYSVILCLFSLALYYSINAVPG